MLVMLAPECVGWLEEAELTRVYGSDDHEKASDGGQCGAVQAERASFFMLFLMGYHSLFVFARSM
jgi:hypothetical protein